MFLLKILNLFPFYLKARKRKDIQRSSFSWFTFHLPPNSKIWTKPKTKARNPFQVSFVDKRDLSIWTTIFRLSRIYIRKLDQKQKLGLEWGTQTWDAGISSRSEQLDQTLASSKTSLQSQIIVSSCHSLFILPSHCHAALISVFHRSCSCTNLQVATKKHYASILVLFLASHHHLTIFPRMTFTHILSWWSPIHPLCCHSTHQTTSLNLISKASVGLEYMGSIQKWGAQLCLPQVYMSS